MERKCKCVDLFLSKQKYITYTDIIWLYMVVDYGTREKEVESKLKKRVPSRVIHKLASLS